MDTSSNSIILSHFWKTLNTMRENEEYCDLVFEVNSCKFSAHRLVFGVWSPPLKNLLNLPTVCTQHISVAYDKPEAFQKFLTFLYTGVLPEEVTHIQGVLLLAATFQIHLLVKLCEEHLKTSTTVENVISMYHLGMTFQLPELEVHCVDFLCRNPIEVAKQQELKNFTSTQLNFFLGSEKMSKLNPEIKLFLIISWIAEDVNYREQFLVMLLRHIEWPVMAKDFLAEIIETENYFTTHPSSLYLLLQTLHYSSFSLGPYNSLFQSLKQQYSHLLNSNVSSSFILDSGKLTQFTPLSYSLQACSNYDPLVFDLHKDTTSVCGIKKEAASFDNSDKLVHFETSGSDLKEDSLDTPIETLEISKGISTSKLPPKILYSKTIDAKNPCAEISLTDNTNIEGNKKRKSLRPRHISPTSVLAKKKIRIAFSERKKNESKGNARNQSSTTKNEQGTLNLETSTRDLRTKKNINKFIRQPDLVLGKLKTKLKKKNVESSKARNQLQAKRGQHSEKITSQQTSKKASTEYQNTRMTRQDIKEENSKSTVHKELLTKKGHAKALKCPHCDYKTLKQLMLEKHQKQKSKTATVTLSIYQVHEGICLFSCSLCSFKSKWSKKFYDHLKQTHYPGPPYGCDQAECNYNTNKFPELMSHIKTHSDFRPFLCDICHTAFRNRNNLYQHVKIHSDEKQHKCLICARGFKHKVTLEQHMVTHSDLRPYLCDLCGFSTKFQSHLISHKRIHTGDVYCCSFPSCSYSTPKKSQLGKHMRIHLLIRPHVCKTCGRGFTEKSHLHRHEGLHSSERAHVCKDCYYSSNRPERLKAHIQKHHSTEPTITKATSGKRYQKNISKMASNYNDEINNLVDNSDSFIDRVVVTDKSRPSKYSYPPTEKQSSQFLKGSDINTSLLPMCSSLPFVQNDGAASSTDTSASFVENVISIGYNNAKKAETGIGSVEVVIKSNQSQDSINNVSGSIFERQVQPDVTCTVGDEPSVSSLENNHWLAAAGLQINQQKQN